MRIFRFPLSFRWVLFSVSFLFAGMISAATGSGTFIRNEGQWPAGFQFRAQNGSHRIWLGEQQIYYQLRRADLHPLSQLHALRFGEPRDSSNIIGHDYRVKFTNSRPVKPQSASQPSSTRYNFFLGNKASTEAR